MREMRVAELGFTQSRGAEPAPVVLLGEVDGERYLPIWIGDWEASAIALAASRSPTKRPLTHELMIQVIQSLGHHLDSVFISELCNDTFHAELVFDNGIRVSARASDAIALALQAGVIIHAADGVLTQAAVTGSRINTHDEDSDTPDDRSQDDLHSQLEKFREFLNRTRPEDFDPG